MSWKRRGGAGEGKRGVSVQDPSGKGRMSPEKRVRSEREVGMREGMLTGGTGQGLRPKLFQSQEASLISLIISTWR